MTARTPSIHVFLGLPLFLLSPGIHSIINFGSLSSCILLSLSFPFIPYYLFFIRCFLFFFAFFFILSFNFICFTTMMFSFQLVFLPSLATLIYFLSRLLSVCIPLSLRSSLHLFGASPCSLLLQPAYKYY